MNAEPTGNITRNDAERYQALFNKKCLVPFEAQREYVMAAIASKSLLWACFAFGISAFCPAGPAWAATDIYHRSVGLHTLGVQQTHKRQGAGTMMEMAVSGDQLRSQLPSESDVESIIKRQAVVVRQSGNGMNQGGCGDNEIELKIIECREGAFHIV